MQIFVSAFILIIIFILCAYVSAKSDSKKKERENKFLEEIVYRSTLKAIKDSCEIND